MLSSKIELVQSVNMANCWPKRAAQGTQLKRCRPLSHRSRDSTAALPQRIPDLPQQTYQNLLNALAQEFTYTFGGSTIIRGLDGSYLSRVGVRMQDRIHLIYADTPFALAENFESLSRYTDALREAAFEALTEETILVVVLQVYHAE